MKTYDAIIVLGRGIKKDGELPNSAVQSTQKAVELWKQGVAPRIILSGKWSRHFDYTPVTTEAAAMAEVAYIAGASTESVLLEDESLDTITNFYFVKTKILVPNNWKKILLVTPHENTQRAPYMMEYILGPDYTCDTVWSGFNFPVEKLKALNDSEAEKMDILKKFLRQVEPGDEKAILKIHEEYIKNNP